MCHQISLSSILQEVFRVSQLFWFKFSFNTVSSFSFIHCPYIIFSVGLSVSSGDFPSRSLKCFFHFWRLSSRLATFSFPQGVLLLSLPNFWLYWFGLVCILVCFFFYFVLFCLFVCFYLFLRGGVYASVNSFIAFLSLCTLLLVGFLFLSMDNFC